MKSQKQMEPDTMLVGILVLGISFEEDRHAKRIEREYRATVAEENLHHSGLV